MARAGIRDIVFGLAAAGLLMGCVEGGGKTGDGSGILSAPAKKKSGGQDVEAPEVFEATDTALWDGRPSLGGIWVAAPEVTNPERAIMFNPATGKSVTGALFKRERENPGPRLQLSSDAAEALGILAGQPTEIRVTALRKAEVAEEAPAEDAVATETEAAAPAEEKAEPAKEKEAAALAAAALTAVEADKAGEKTAPAPAADPAADPAAVAAATAAGVAAVAADGAEAAVDQKPKRKTWKERRAEAKAAREAKKKAAAEAKAAASAAEAEAALAAGEAPTATPETAAVAPIESAPLDARKPEVTDGTAAAKPARKTVAEPAAPAAAETAAPEAAAPEAAPAVAGGPARPIQVASFSKEDNAKRASEALAKIGITATPQKSEKDGKAVWGVIVKGDEAMLKKIKDAGFADAYFLK